jgi:hypothetical protein
MSQFTEHLSITMRGGDGHFGYTGSEIAAQLASEAGAVSSLTVDVTVAEGVDLILGTVTGTKIGTAADQKLGLYGKAPVVQGAALTAQLTAITHTAPSSQDFALQALVQNTGFGFVTADEGHTLLQVVANLQARLAEVEARLEGIGLVAAN